MPRDPERGEWPGRLFLRGDSLQAPARGMPPAGQRLRRGKRTHWMKIAEGRNNYHVALALRGERFNRFVVIVDDAWTTPPESTPLFAPHPLEISGLTVSFPVATPIHRKMCRFSLSTKLTRTYPSPNAPPLPNALRYIASRPPPALHESVSFSPRSPRISSSSEPGT